MCWELWQQTEKEANGRTKWEMLKELVDYAREKNVDIWVWRASSPRFGNKSDIGLVDPAERAGFMKKCAEVGVKGLKIDFFHTENAFTVNLMENILKDAAKEKLMVIFHGVNKPTREIRIPTRIYWQKRLKEAWNVSVAKIAGLPDHLAVS